MLTNRRGRGSVGGMIVVIEEVVGWWRMEERERGVMGVVLR